MNGCDERCGVEANDAVVSILVIWAVVSAHHERSNVAVHNCTGAYLRGKLKEGESPLQVWGGLQACDPHSAVDR
eukprot:1439085-Pyramimonas_sp.AAC.1